jgi:hypothetical protein
LDVFWKDVVVLGATACTSCSILVFDARCLLFWMLKGFVCLVGGAFFADCGSDYRRRIASPRPRAALGSSALTDGTDKPKQQLIQIGAGELRLVSVPQTVR